MRKVSALSVPTALLASACMPVMPAADPSEDAFLGTDLSTALWVGPPVDAPPTTTMVLPSVNDALSEWMLPAKNPWAAYQKATLLTALDDREEAADLPEVAHLDEVVRARAAADYVARTALPPATMWVVDLRGAASVAFGTELSVMSHDPVTLILTFHNWPADNETIPAEETLAALVTMRPHTLSPRPGIPVFLLDAWRLTHRYDRPDDEAVDNRYMLTPSDLPDPSVLEARGISRVLYVIDGDEETRNEEDDLHALFLLYQEAGIELSIIDLADLTDPEAEPYYGQSLMINPLRVTIVGDPSFYHRARGGFGGPHVIYGGWSPDGGHMHTFPFHGGG
jgi:hypothetical protein